MKRKNILVTGGAGFVGSNLCRSLIANSSVSVLDDFSSGRRENLPEGVELIEGDVSDKGTIEKAVRGKDIIFHLAAIASVQKCISQPEKAARINAESTRMLLDASVNAGVERFIFASSCAVYGNSKPPLSEESPVKPLSPYAETKLLSEKYCREYSGRITAVCPRFFNIYGPRQDQHSDYAAAIPLFITRALAGEPITVYGDGQQTRDFIFIDDVVSAFENLACVSSAHSGQVFNIGSGRATSVNELAQTIVKLAGSKSEILYDDARLGEVRNSWAAAAKAKSVIGFSPKYSLEKGLKKTIEWFYG